MKDIKSIFAGFAMFMCLLLQGKGVNSEISVIPYPQSVEFAKGSFNLYGAQFSCDAAIDSRSRKAIDQFALQISKVSGKNISVTASVGVFEDTRHGTVKGVAFYMDSKLASGEYRIKIAKKNVAVCASDRYGFLYAIQTMKQMMPVEIYGDKMVEGLDWKLPCLEIKDAPRFGYRGIMLDCGRHFFSIDEIKKVLDIMAIHKQNRLHWHLTEDQGWRIEIKRHPELTEIGAFRNGTQIGRDANNIDNIRYGGYYTQNQIKDIIEYADELGISIIPEIDLPGHIQSLLASHPEFGNGTGPYEVRKIWGVTPHVLNVGKEETMLFIEDVIDEVATLFPSEYFNIGGDECPKGEWENSPECQAKIQELGLKDDEFGSAEQHLQNYVIARIQKFLAARGKKIVGWDDILEGKLYPGATIIGCAGTKGGIKAAKLGFDVIMSPNKYCYLDYYQISPTDNEPLAIGGYVPVGKAYSLEPTADIPDEAKKHILGVQASLWTEYIATPDYLEYMLLPRLQAISEVQWCQPEVKNYERFKKILINHGFQIMKKMGFNFCEKVQDLQ